MGAGLAHIDALGRSQSLTFSVHLDAHLPLLGMILRRIETQRWKMNRPEKHATLEGSKIGNSKTQQEAF